jgi:hypothetical protein
MICAPSGRVNWLADLELRMINIGSPQRSDDIKRSSLRAYSESSASAPGIVSGVEGGARILGVETGVRLFGSGVASRAQSTSPVT